MNIDKTLTKEGFWNSMMERFPLSMKLFCKWIDDYKEAVKWTNLFNEHSLESAPVTIKAPKFHEIPYEMQQGIWICFCNNTLHKFYEQPEYNYRFDLEEDIKEVFSELESIIKEYPEQAQRRIGNNLKNKKQ